MSQRSGIHAPRQLASILRDELVDASFNPVSPMPPLPNLRPADGLRFDHDDFAPRLASERAAESPVNRRPMTATSALSGNGCAGEWHLTVGEPVVSSWACFCKNLTTGHRGTQGDKEEFIRCPRVRLVYLGVLCG